MAEANTPAAEIGISVEMVRELLTEQHPDLAGLGLAEFASGWDNVMFRLGESLVVRLPRRQASAELVVHEQRWLPELAARLPLPLPLPVPLRVGRPNARYPWAWSILPWIEGDVVGDEPPVNPDRMALDLGRFLAALHTPAPDSAPVNLVRGIPLSGRDEVTWERIQRLRPTIDADAVEKLWSEAVETEPWAGPPLWLHGDLHPLNLLHDGERLVAVIDFGDITSGDPATDLAAAWYLFDAEHREVFRAAADSPTRPIDSAMWTRARGWALSVALTLVASSADNPIMSRVGRKAINAVLADG